MGIDQQSNRRSTRKSDAAARTRQFALQLLARIGPLHSLARQALLARQAARGVRHPGRQTARRLWLRCVFAPPSTISQPLNLNLARPSNSLTTTYSPAVSLPLSDPCP